MDLFAFSQLDQGILHRKADSNVLILGPYRPSNAKKLLQRLRDCLRKDGYSCTSLVEDLPFRKMRKGERPEEYFLEKSKALISNWAQFPLYVFPSNADYSGVIIEFEYMVYEVARLLPDSSVFFQKRNFKNTSMMLRGRIRASKINQRFYSTKEQLCEAAVAELFSHLRRVY